VEVWDVNWKAFTLFLDCGSRWRWLSGMGGAVRLGLDLVQVDVLLRRRRLRGRIFHDLLTMESAALEAFREAQS